MDPHIWDELSMILPFDTNKFSPSSQMSTWAVFFKMCTKFLIPRLTIDEEWYSNGRVAFQWSCPQLDPTGLDLRPPATLCFPGEGSCTVTSHLLSGPYQPVLIFHQVQTHGASKVTLVQGPAGCIPSKTQTLIWHPTFITASVCSSSQPTKAWPDSWNATTFCSSFERILLFLAVPERTPRTLSSGTLIILRKCVRTLLDEPWEIFTLCHCQSEVVTRCSPPASQAMLTPTTIPYYFSNLKGNSLGRCWGGHVCFHFLKWYNNQTASAGFAGGAVGLTGLAQGPHQTLVSCWHGQLQPLWLYSSFSPSVVDHLLPWWLYLTFSLSLSSHLMQPE